MEPMVFVEAVKLMLTVLEQLVVTACRVDPVSTVPLHYVQLDLMVVSLPLDNLQDVLLQPVTSSVLTETTRLFAILVLFFAKILAFPMSGVLDVPLF